MEVEASRTKCLNRQGGARRARTERQATLAYVREVHELCALAGRDGQAATFIAEATPVARVRRALHEARAAEDEANRVRMIDLSQRAEPYEIELPYGLTVTVEPLTTAGMAATQAAARRAVEAIERQITERKEAGLSTDGLPQLDDDGKRDGFYQCQLIWNLAVRHITDWTGAELEGAQAPPTPENIGAVMNLYPIGERFFQEFTLRQVLLNAAKNGSGLSAAGISSQTEGPNTAEDVETTGRPAAEENAEQTDGSARIENTV